MCLACPLQERVKLANFGGEAVDAALLLVHRCRHAQQVVPIVADEIDVDPWAEMSP
jgi:hypothetical protein